MQIFYLVISHVSLKVLPNIYQHIYSRCRSRQVWMSLKKKCVLITGATEKTGRGLAVKFAERGMRVILVDKDKCRLEELQAQISKIGECCVYHVSHGRGSSLSFVDKHDIGVLVNCTGFTDECPAYFVEQPVEEIMMDLVDIMLFTKRILANMMENRHGYVLNIGPLVCGFPNPLCSMPEDSKYAIKSLSESLYYELETYNINVEYVNAGRISSHTTDAKGSSLFVPSTDRFAESVLNTFGSGRMSVPYFPHFLLYLLLLCIPSSLLSRLIFRRNQRIMAKTKEKRLSLAESKMK